MELNKKAIEQLDKEYVTGYGVMDNSELEGKSRDSLSKSRSRYRKSPN